MDLLKKGSLEKIDMKSILQPQKNDEHNYYRAIKDLQDIDVVEGEERLTLTGHGEPEQIQVLVGPRSFKIIMPLNKGLARRLLNRRPIITEAIMRRGGVAYEVLKETGLIEKEEEKRDG